MDQNTELDHLFERYRTALPDPEASVNFMPELWRKIEGRQFFLARVKKLQALQAMGLSLDDIAHVLPLYYADPTGVAGKKKIIELLRRQLEETDRKLAAIQAFRDELLRNITKFELFVKHSSHR